MPGKKKSNIAKNCMSAVLVTVLAVSALGTPEAAFAVEDGIQVSQTATNESQYQDDNSDKVRDKQGVVSQLNTTTHNPYNKLITVRIDIGSEFAEFDGSNSTEAVVIKCNPGDYIDLPRIKARPGYTFIGWNQGGVGEPMWTPDVTTVQMTEDATGGKSTVIDAIYMNDEGDGYCTCGAWVEGYFKDDIDKYKDAYEEYLSTSGYDGDDIPVLQETAGISSSPLLYATVLLAVLVIVLLLVLVMMRRGKNRDGDGIADGQHVKIGQHGRVEASSRPVAAGEQIAVYDSLHPDLRPAVDFVAAIEAASRNARGQ